MIGIPTPTCVPSPNWSETCTGLPVGLAGALLVGVLDAEDEVADPAAVCVTVFTVPGFGLFEPHADTASAAATTTAIRPNTGRTRCEKREDVTRTP
jgi:hypothetical protein